ncbi:MAG: UDP-N-acetylmuramoyl-tripeptide--D-alanyl-D-alanine ligase [Firmicutes bacterium]|nr:UDP-N-acetylmuramoyl-tripeptide--D-alanyl-D-alanine ligase [Bacillota bacterium]
MRPITVHELTKWISGRLLRGQKLSTITGVTTDSRTVKPGDLFIPLVGERFDGHDFVRTALSGGAVATLVEENRAGGIMDGFAKGSYPDTEFSVIGVQDTLLALQDLARAYRNLFDLPIIAVTGSTGKTTTKDMIASICSQMGPVLKSPENFNNEIGLPLTLLQLDHEHLYGVVEMGMRGRGQIRELTRIASPQVGLVTNVGVVHMELLGTQEAIAEAKAELLEDMAPGSVAILNADDDLVRQMAHSCQDIDVIFYGYRKPRPTTPTGSRYVTATNIVARGALGVRFQIHYDGDRVDIDLPLPGAYQVHNALAAAAAAFAVGASPWHVQSGLSKAQLSSMRMEQIQLTGGGLIINDAYNANPTSMAAALEVAHEIAAGRPLVFILGDMLELGHLSKEAHYQIGRQVASYGPRFLIAVGNWAQEIARGARNAGMAGDLIVECWDQTVAQSVVGELVQSGDVVLVKGSRGIALEHVVEVLRTQFGSMGRG